jgi:hypothetical protein
MPVENYGVLIGSYAGFYRDQPNNEGRYLHGHVQVGPSPVIDCAVDVNHRTGNIDYLHLRKLDPAQMQGVQNLPWGYHPLLSTSTSGALDYVRNPLISVPLGCAAIIVTFFNAIFHTHLEVWKRNSGMAALLELETMVTGAPIDTVYIFGARWNNAQQNPPWGMHDIHFNQGDPPGPFQHLDGVWQDGGVMVKRPDGTFEAFLVKFTTQTMDTNDQTGLPN